MIEIRVAEPGDYDRIAELTVAAYSSLDGGRVSPEYERSLADVADRARHAVVLVALEEGAVVGAATYVPGLGPYAEFEDEDAAGIRMLAVDAAARRRGAGRALVQSCIRRARVEGRARVVLHTTRWMPAARMLYESLGFVRDRARDWTPTPGVHLLGFQLPLRD